MLRFPQHVPDASPLPLWLPPILEVPAQPERDPHELRAVIDAMLTMQKLDVKTLEKAYAEA